jgi:hypothetical protein
LKRIIYLAGLFAGSKTFVILAKANQAIAFMSYPALFTALNLTKTPENGSRKGTDIAGITVVITDIY